MLDTYSIATQGQYCTTGYFGSADGFYTVTVTEQLVAEPETGTGVTSSAGGRVNDSNLIKLIQIEVDVDGRKYKSEVTTKDIALKVNDVSLNNEQKQVTVMMKAAEFEDTEPRTEEITVDLIEVEE